MESPFETQVLILICKYVCNMIFADFLSMRGWVWSFKTSLSSELRHHLATCPVISNYEYYEQFPSFITRMLENWRCNS